LVLDTGAKVKNCMKHLDLNKHVVYTDEPVKFGRILTDNFLPTPAELAREEKSVKVTISLNKESVDFFKKEAAKSGGQYQRMIRRLLIAYAQRAKQK
jgi:predicted DNA binding CopG/RHH family protein